jgi:hypothetical protein
MSLPEEQFLYKEPPSPIGRMQLGLAALIVTPSPKKTDGNGGRAVNDEPFINMRKPSSTTAVIGVLSNGPSPKKMDGNGDQVVNHKLFINKRKPSSTLAVKGVLNNGEHMLIPVTAKMIYSAVWNGERFVLTDSQPLHMVKLVGAIRNFHVNVKHVQINLKDGTGLVQVILWQKQKECTAQRHLIDKCNGNRYIRVIGEIEDYYGVHEIISFNVQPVSSGNEVTHHFLEVAYSYEKQLECMEDKMMKSVPLV